MGKGVGSALMNEAIRLAKELGCRKIMLGTTEGNERAVRLYKKFGFKIEAYEDDGVYIEGSWRKNYIMGLELAPCEPKLERPLLTHLPTSLPATSKADINVRQLMEHDLDELHRLQNCTESTKSSHRIPPITKEEAKRWYEELKSMEGKYCIACFKGDKILGYLRFRAGFLPFPSPRFEEAIVDVNEMPYESADAIVRAVKDFRERYGYRRIFAYIPETSSPIVGALEHHSFNKAGAMKCYYFVDGYYVDVALYGYP
ncbi:MAG: putative acetyltransferase YhhY [Candidatus Bathyarchaeota archaeon BA1]|nr:MAG: putative acetyltransferase YhhY [Candidatus Bathyarchaeota archaeon BA1]